MEQHVTDEQQVVIETNKVSKKKGFFTKLLKVSLAFLFMVPALIFWFLAAIVLVVVLSFSGGGEDNKCNVARVPVQGIIATTNNGLTGMLDLGPVTSADSIIEKINRAENDDSIVATIIDIDSPGGTPVAGDEIMRALLAATKPTVAVIRDRGTSAAYWAAAGTDYIVASPVSDVGSIGVTMSYLELASSTEYQGSRWIDISSGAYKDAGHPERVLSNVEREHFQNEVDEVHEYMVTQIASARDPLSREDLAALADGRAYLGTDALPLGLIDEIGGFEEAVQYLTNLLLPGEALTICPTSYGALEDLFY